jgi:hypothetical protein
MQRSQRIKKTPPPPNVVEDDDTASDNSEPIEDSEDEEPTESDLEFVVDDDEEEEEEEDEEEASFEPVEATQRVINYDGRVGVGTFIGKELVDFTPIKSLPKKPITEVVEDSKPVEAQPPEAK